MVSMCGKQLILITQKGGICRRGRIDVGFYSKSYLFLPIGSLDFSKVVSFRKLENYPYIVFAVFPTVLLIRELRLKVIIYENNKFFHLQFVDKKYF